MADTAITAVLSKCGELATREAKVLLQVGDDIMLLRDRLEWLQAFVRDADRKRRVGTDDLTRVWVRQARDVAFEAEDALDEFFHKVDLESQGRRGWKLWLGHFSINRMTVRHALSSRMSKIKSRLDQISENQKEYNIDYAPSGIYTSAKMSLISRDGNDKVMDCHNMKTIKNQLTCEDHPERKFISIVGESGVGKNTLVTQILKMVKTSFKIVVKYTMPPDCSKEDLVRQVYIRVQEELKSSLKKEGSVVPAEFDSNFAKGLYDLLADKNYLLILGGISSKIILSCLAASLPCNKKGSRVVLTLEPESEEVAFHAATLNGSEEAMDQYYYTHRLNRLDKERSKSLFRRRAFGTQGQNMDKQAEDQMTRYEEDMYHVTGGHPLAIVVLAGLLRYKERPVEWDAVLQHLKPGMEEQEGGGTSAVEEQEGGGTALILSKDKPVVEWLQQMISPARGEPKLSNRMAIERIFSSSFDDLPQDLKSCFLYFAAYPEDISHDADQIVQLWTAEGFIRPRKGKTMEQLGHSYLKELVSRCLVELVGTTDICDGIRKVRVHKCLLMFLQSEAHEASFIEVHDKNDVLAPASVRRLSIQDDSGSYIKFTNKFPKLRTFICRIEEQVQGNSSGQNKKQSQGSTAAGQAKEQSQGDNNGSDAGQAKKQSQGSSSSGAGLQAKEQSQGNNKGSDAGQAKKQNQGSTEPYDVKFLCGSKFLRVLSMQGSNLKELPEEIGDLIHLRYLRVDCKKLKDLPSSIKKLLNLQTLDISDTNVDNIDQEFWLIKTLRHVFAKELKLPASVENMKELGDLQTLHGVQLSKQGEDMQPHCGFSKPVKPAEYPLDRMTRLRSLEICGFNHTDHATALESALGKMHLLGHLKLKGDQIPLCVFTEPSLQCLQTMVLDGTVEWPKVTPLDLSHIRPNLVSLKVEHTKGEHEKISDEQEKILVEEKKRVDGLKIEKTKLGALLSK